VERYVVCSNSVERYVVCRNSVEHSQKSHPLEQKAMWSGRSYRCVRVTAQLIVTEQYAGCCRL
jgi:hypothetical protein